MSLLQTHLFFRIISKNREVYVLKIVTLAVAFACSTLILLFSINEFGYDKFHHDYQSIFRLLRKTNIESYNGNRLSNKISLDITKALKSIHADSLITSKVKMLDKVNVRVGKQLFNDDRLYAADGEITHIFTFEIVQGSLADFQDKENTVVLSSAASIKYFGAEASVGRKLKIFTFGDTLSFRVVAVYKDYPQNSHEEFNGFIRFDNSSIQSLHFNPEQVALYCKLIESNKSDYESKIDRLDASKNLTYRFQPISEIYFGPRVMGEDAKHGDYYSIVILICITSLILFLSLTSFINLTTLTLPYRSKEFAIKKMAGTSQANLVIDFLKESLLTVGASLVLSVLFLALTANWIQPMLSIDVISLLLQRNSLMMFILLILSLAIALAPTLMALRFARATPNRLLSTDVITFPRFKRMIIFLQLGISIFLIVSSMVIRRQINYSLVKEPGRNYDQIAYVNYPRSLTNEGLMNLRATWKRINPNIVDVMGTSQLPDRVSSKEINSDFYFMSVDRGFKDFFNIKMVRGDWFSVNDGDSIILVNEEGGVVLDDHPANVIGVFEDFSGEFNQAGKPIKINVAPYFNYNFLCIRVLEVDIRRTIGFLETYFEQGSQKARVSFLNKRFEEWLKYQDRLNTLSEVLAIISALLSCCAIYGYEH